MQLSHFNRIFLESEWFNNENSCDATGPCETRRCDCKSVRHSCSPLRSFHLSEAGEEGGRGPLAGFSARSDRTRQRVIYIVAQRRPSLAADLSLTFAMPGHCTRREVFIASAHHFVDAPLATMTASDVFECDAAFICRPFCPFPQYLFTFDLSWVRFHSVIQNMQLDVFYLLCVLLLLLLLFQSFSKRTACTLQRGRLLFGALQRADHSLQVFLETQNSAHGK